MMGPDIAVRLSAVGADGVRREIKGVATELGQMDAASRRSAEGAESVAGGLGRIAQYGVAGGGLAAVAAATLSIGRTLVDASIAAERLSLGLGFATGNAPRDIAYLREVTHRLGLQFGATSTAYMQFAAAARETSLEGEGARRVFESVAKASAVMGLSAADTQGVLLALQQMISKGTVSAEELRGQLGERLPGSFQIAARAMGVTTQELGKMLEQGRVVSEEFLPRFARQLETELGGAAEKAADRTEASINRMSNAWTQLMQTLGQAGVSDAAGWLSGAIANDLQALADAAESARASGGGWLRQWTEVTSTAIGRMLGLQGVLPVFRTAQQQAQAMQAQLGEAEAEMAKLQARLAVNPESFYLRNDIAQLQQFINKAREAQQAALMVRMPDQTEAETARLRAAAGEDQSAAETARLAGARPRGAFAGSAAAELLKQYASDASRLSQELMRAREAFGGVIPADIERSIRERFVKPTREAGDEARRLADLLQGATGFTSTWAQDVGTLGRALAAGRISQTQYNDAIQALIDKQPGIKAFREEQQKQLDAAAKAALEAIKRYDAAEAAADSQLQTAKDMLAAIQRETAALRMSTTEREISNAMRALEEKGLKAGTAAYDEYAEAIRKAIIDRETVRKSIEASDAIAADWKRRMDDIERSLTDALMRGFEGGRGFLDSLISTVRSAFKTLVLQPIVRAIVQPVMGGAASLLGVSGAQAATGAGAGGMSGLSLAGAAGGLQNAWGSYMGAWGSAGTAASSVFSTGGAATTPALIESAAGTAGYGASSAGTGAAWGAGAQAVGGALVGVYGGRAISGGYSVTGGSGNSMVNAGTAAGAAIGTLFYGQTALGAAIGGLIGGALNRAFGRREAEVTGGGITGTLSAAGFSGSQYTDWIQRGGWFRSDRTGSDLGEVNTALAEVLRAGTSAATRQVQAYAEALGLPVDAIRGYSRAIRVELRGLTDQQAAEAIQKQIQEFQDGLASQYEAMLSPLARAGESVAQTFVRLAGLQQFSRNLNELGTVFARVANLAVDVREQMIAMAGGMDVFSQNALSFVQNYYSRDEIAGLKARELQGVLAGLGIAQDFVGADAAAQFRALVEGTDVGSDAGRRQLATLLGIQGDFAQVAQYLGETGLSLSGAAGQAGAVGPLQSIFQQASSEQVVATQQAAQQQVAATQSAAVVVATAVDALHQTIREQAAASPAAEVSGWAPVPTSDIAAALQTIIQAAVGNAADIGGWSGRRLNEVVIPESTGGF